MKSKHADPNRIFNYDFDGCTGHSYICFIDPSHDAGPMWDPPH